MIMTWKVGFDGRSILILGLFYFRLEVSNLNHPLTGELGLT